MCCFSTIRASAESDDQELPSRMATSLSPGAVPFKEMATRIPTPPLFAGLYTGPCVSSQPATATEDTKKDLASAALSELSSAIPSVNEAEKQRPTSGFLPTLHRMFPNATDQNLAFTFNKNLAPIFHSSRRNSNPASTSTLLSGLSTLPRELRDRIYLLCMANNYLGDRPILELPTWPQTPRTRYNWVKMCRPVLKLRDPKLISLALNKTVWDEAKAVADARGLIGISLGHWSPSCFQLRTMCEYEPAIGGCKQYRHIPQDLWASCCGLDFDLYFSMNTDDARLLMLHRIDTIARMVRIKDSLDVLSINVRMPCVRLYPDAAILWLACMEPLRALRNVRRLVINCGLTPTDCINRLGQPDYWRGGMVVGWCFECTELWADGHIGSLIRRLEQDVSDNFVAEQKALEDEEL